jgi:hypothetical protein
VTIAITGRVTRAWPLIAAAPGWDFRGPPGPDTAASLPLTTDQPRHLLTNILHAAGNHTSRPPVTTRSSASCSRNG